MNFGFSSGDQTIAEPYFYVTACPAPAGWAGGPLPEPAHWHTAGFLAAALPYAAVNGAELLANFLHTAHLARRQLMSRD